MTELLEVVGTLVGLLVVVALIRAAWELGPTLALLIGGKVNRGRMNLCIGSTPDGRRFRFVEAPDGRILWAGPAREEDDE